MNDYPRIVVLISVVINLYVVGHFQAGKRTNEKKSSITLFGFTFWEGMKFRLTIDIVLKFILTFLH